MSCLQRLSKKSTGSLKVCKSPTLVAIADHTNQPHAWLKELLNDICILHKTGPYANHFSLKDEWKTSNR